VAILGLADDLGVRLNNGRPGAAEGPAAFRAALAKYGVAEPYGWDWPGIVDAGDVVAAEGEDEVALRETHRRVSEAVRAVLEQGLFPIGIGGGHDLTFPFVRGVVEHWRGRGVSVAAGVYFDAHLDVRDRAGSGMPFRRLIEDCGVSALEVHGLDSFANAREHVHWFDEHGGVVGRDGMRPEEFSLQGDKFVSVDLDVLDASSAPGVSAINPSGWDVGRLEAWVRVLGLNPRVRCIDFMELCPPHDVGGRTARVAARLFLAFLASFARRGVS